MQTYRISDIPVQLTDENVRAFCASQNVELAEGPTIGSGFVEITTVDEIQDIPALEEAVDLAIKSVQGRITKIR